MEDADKNKIRELLKSMQNIHFPLSYTHSGFSKLNMITAQNENKLEAIYNLIESHAPGLRYSAVASYQKTLDVLADNTHALINKEEIDFKCNRNCTNGVENLIKSLSEMPKEWSIVQLTTEYSSKENIKVNPEKFYTNTLHVTVLNCGSDQVPPFTMAIGPPIDNISGNVIEVRQEMHDILRDNEINLTKYKEKYKQRTRFITTADKLMYVDDRNSLNNRLEGLVNVVQNRWLDAWRCLFIGKLVDNKLEKKVTKAVEELLKEHNYRSISEKNKILLKYLIKGSGYLRVATLKKGLKYIFPRDEDKNIRVGFNKLMQSKEFNFEHQKRHPIILIVDEALDAIPWEMVDVLHNQSVSRVPSLHFVYGLYKEHKSKIVSGLLEIHTTSNATYMLNPGLDLKAMQFRMNGFFKYWRPDWSGIVGVEPTEEVFLKTLTESDIFIYCGHGSGTQFLKGEIIQKTKINSVVFLFGCGSIKLSTLGPQAETCSTYFNYLIASSPCVIGMLWMVTDFETDCLATEVLSQWIPSDAPTDWNLIAKDKWSIDGSVVPTPHKTNMNTICLHEPELLKALAVARKTSGKYITRAACIARGLPVKIV